jgi:hypothetical protein
MGRIALSFLLGFFAIPAFILGGEPLEQGQLPPFAGLLIAGAAEALCLAVCQFLVVRDGSGGELLERRPVLVAMLVPVIGMGCLMWVLDPAARQTAPAFLSAGIVGVVGGAVLGNFKR